MFRYMVSLSSFTEIRPVTDDRRGYDVLRRAALNKSTAFSREEREELGLRGLLPHKVGSMAVQEQRVLGNIRRKAYDIERYIYLESRATRFVLDVLRDSQPIKVELTVE